MKPRPFCGNFGSPSAPRRVDHAYTRRLLSCAALTGLLAAYCAITVVYWDVDNSFPDLHPHTTLVQWIEANQIRHLRSMVRDLW